MVDDKEVLLTSSEDCSTRLWTTKGHYIGTVIEECYMYNYTSQNCTVKVYTHASIWQGKI